MTPNAPLRVLIADDEPLARQRLEDLLRRQPGVDIVGLAENGDAAVRAIQERRPDLVFLDVQMPGRTGLDVVREIGVDAMPATVFVTAYDQHALKAFELAALDYLVKPFDDERFEQAFARARRLVELRQFGDLRQQLLRVLDGVPATAQVAPSPREYLERIAVEMKGRIRVVPVSEIQYITSDGPYAELHVADRRFVIRESMQTLQERLDPRVFFRVHRSAMVRVDQIETLLKGAGGDYEVLLKDGTRLRVSRSRREALERLLGVAR